MPTLRNKKNFKSQSYFTLQEKEEQTKPKVRRKEIMNSAEIKQGLKKTIGNMKLSRFFEKINKNWQNFS